MDRRNLQHSTRTLHCSTIRTRGAVAEGSSITQKAPKRPRERKKKLSNQGKYDQKRSKSKKLSFFEESLVDFTRCAHNPTSGRPHMLRVMKRCVSFTPPRERPSGVRRSYYRANGLDRSLQGAAELRTALVFCCFQGSVRPSHHFHMLSSTSRPLTRVASTRTRVALLGSQCVASIPVDYEILNQLEKK